MSEPPAVRTTAPLAALYAVTVGFGAALLFGVQPLAARAMLPAYGGSSAVWTLCLLFFQTALLLGYGWAHLSLRWLTERRQAVLQVALVTLPLLWSASAAPLGREPAAGALAISLIASLASGVGLTFVVLASTSPLLQRWFAASTLGTRNVYWLYAASNAGSLGSLLAYPLVVEPFLSLPTQFAALRWGVGIYAVLVLACAIALWTRAPATTEAVTAPAEARNDDVDARRRLRWIVLAAIPSSLLSSLTAYLTTDLASGPLLWVVPLVLYLLSFILIYRDRPLITPERSSRILPLALMAVAFTSSVRASGPLLVLLVAGLAVTFLAATLAHGLLYEDRPSPARLTEFYLLASVGGALGGAFNALIAPLIFDDLHELPVGLLALCALRAWATKPQDDSSLARDAAHGFAALGLGLIGFGLRRFVPPVLANEPLPVFLLPMFLVLRDLHWPRRFGFGIAALLLIGFAFRRASADTLYEGRSFYGPLRVEQSLDGTFRRVRHGITFHGVQHQKPALRDEPTGYYHPDGPLGDALAIWRRNDPEAARRVVGVVGLGAGTMATSARAGERWTFYELNPLVVRVAEDPALFTFLSAGRARGAQVDVVLGDARQKLQLAPDGGYGLLALDAFSSDAIPMHLLTREALSLYARKITPQGLVAMHVSNLHLDLPPVLAATAKAAGLALACRANLDLSQAQEDALQWPSRWCLLAHEDGRLPSDEKRWPRPAPAKRGWTDERATLLDAVIFPWSKPN